MPQTYAQIVPASADAAWIARVKASIVTAALAIAVDSPATPLDLHRDRMARLVLLDPELWATRFALPVALGFLGDSDLTVANVTDAEIDTRVSSVWNDFVQKG